MTDRIKIFVFNGYYTWRTPNNLFTYKSPTLSGAFKQVSEFFEKQDSAYWIV